MTNKRPGVWAVIYQHKESGHRMVITVNANAPRSTWTRAAQRLWYGGSLRFGTDMFEINVAFIEQDNIQAMNMETIKNTEANVIAALEPYITWKELT